MSSHVIEFADRMLKGGFPVAIATLTESGRDTPGIPGSMMAVCGDGKQAGTIGGGTVEAKVVESCQAALEDPTAATIPFDYSLRENGGLDMLCGGQVKGFITVVRPQRRLVIFGGGHVGQKLYEAGLAAGFSVWVVEDREEFSPHFPKANFVLTDNLADTARELSADGENYIVIVTRGHAHDYTVLSAVASGHAAYIGMIGSRLKVKTLLKKLREQGTSRQVLDTIYSPIGLDIDDGTPGEIAIGIMAEIIAVKNKKPLRHCRDRVTRISD